MANNEAFTEWVKHNPWRWALLSGAAALAWSLVLFGVGPQLWFWVPVAVAFGAANGIVWRPGGPGARWNAALRRRYPPSGTR